MNYHLSHQFRSRCLLLVLALLSFGTSGRTATYVVDRTDDAAISACSTASNDCTLRGAITTANANAGADTINFDTTLFNSAQTIALATALPELTGDLTITGPGADLLTIKEEGTGHTIDIFYVFNSISVTFSGLTISNGLNGIYNKHGTFTVTNCIVSGNTSYGIANIYGTLTATNCTVSGNEKGFLNIYVGSTLKAINCTVSGNGFGFSSGDIDGGPVTAINCTVSGNAYGFHTTYKPVTAINCTVSSNTICGIYTTYGIVTATNCTLSGNDTGIRNVSGAVTVSGCTVSGNSNYGLRNQNTYQNTLTIKNSLVVGSRINLSGAFTDGGYNITSGTATQAGLEVDGSGTPVLADNGGPTKIIKLLAGSPAIDRGNSFGVTTDQRGQARPYDNPAIANASGGDGSDIGAYEVQAPPPVTLAVNNPRSLNEGSPAAPGSITFDITLSAASTQSVTVNYQTVNGINNPAIAGNDYVAKSGKLTFAPGETLKRVTIGFIGDNAPEASETFFFDLKTPTNANIADSRGVGTINNDDGPSLSVGNAAVDEGNSGLTPQTFVVRLSAPSTDTVTVSWTTADGTAGASAESADYIAAMGTLSFAPGQTSKIITIQVKGDTTVEPDETYKINLNRPAYALIADGTGVGTIRNDDATALLFENGEPSQ